MTRQNRRTKQTSVVDSSSPSRSSPAVGDKKDYRERVTELELENNNLKKEIEELRHKLTNDACTPDVGSLKIKEAQARKTNAFEEQVLKLKKKLELQSQFSAQRPDAAKRFQDEIQRLKAQKVQLQCKLKLDSVQFRLCKASMQKEIYQLKKEHRRNKFEMHLLLALNRRQKLVVQRKTKEAFMATKRLKELLESRKALSCRKAGARNGNRSQLQSFERELEVTVHVQEVCAEYEGQMEEMEELINKLKLEAEMLKEENSRCLSEDTEVDCRVKDSELRDLQEEVVRLSGLVSKMAIAKAEVVNRKKSEVDLLQSSGSVGISRNLLDIDTSESEHSAGVPATTNTSKSDHSMGVTAANTSESEQSKAVSAANTSGSDHSTGVIAGTGKSVSGVVCCSCSKKSLCKTLKCGCRSAGGSCGTSCGCVASKCTNREAVSVKVDDSLHPIKAEATVDCSRIVETDESCVLASQGATLLEASLVKKPPAKSVVCVSRKQPLREIGNVPPVKSISLKPGHKKKGKKPTQNDSANLPSSS